MKKTEQTALNFIVKKKLIRPGDKVLIALSGGSDSVFLLHFLVKYKKRFKIDIGALHINHKLRGADSNRDQEFCKTICKKQNVEFYSKIKNVKSFALKNKMSIEEAGREIRYKELKLTAKKYNYNKIATAHNSGDNTETILLNLFKGTGIYGISGIPSARENIIRPILSIKKNDIINYLDKNKIEYRVDKSNLSNEYERNFIRNKILPLIKKNINPNIEDSIFRSSEIFKDIKKLIKNGHFDYAKDLIKTEKGKIKILLKSELSNQNENLSFMIKQAVFNNFSIKLNFNNINDILSLSGKRVGQYVDLPGKLVAKKERGMIIINKKILKNGNISLTVKPNNEVKLNSKKIYIEEVGNQKNYELSKDRNLEFISGDEIKGNFKIRNWVDGDKFFPLGLKGSKKVSDYLTEQKTPNYKRREQLVLTNNNKIVWVLGLRLDERFKITSSTKKVYSLCLK